MTATTFPIDLDTTVPPADRVGSAASDSAATRAKTRSKVFRLTIGFGLAVGVVGAVLLGVGSYTHDLIRDQLVSQQIQFPPADSPGMTAEEYPGLQQYAGKAIFNVDPRRFATETRANTRQFRELVSEGFPDLGEREQLRIAAVIRCLVSSQAWLRMREEFGIPGTESGPVVAWVIDTIVRELRAGNGPGSS